MSWFSGVFSSPNPVGGGGRDGGRSSGGRDREKGGRGRERDRSDSRDRGRGRRDRSDSPRDRRRRDSRSPDHRRDRRRSPSRERFDDLDEADERNDRRRERDDRAKRRAREENEELEARERLSPEEREALARKDRERARDRNIRFEDKDEEEDRRKRAEAERERKAEEDAREALRAENEMVQVQEAVAADDAFAEDQSNVGPAAPKKVYIQYMGDLDPKMNNDAAHLFWSGAKALTFLAFFGAAIAQKTASLSPAACNLSPEVKWCLGGPRITDSNPPLAPHLRFCQDYLDSQKVTTTATCQDACALTASSFTAPESLKKGCAFECRGTKATPVTDWLPCDGTVTWQCWPTDTFESLCNNKKACRSSFIDDTQKGYLPCLILFFFCLTLEVLNAAGLYLWTSVHPDEFDSAARSSRPQRWLMYFVKAYPFLSQLFIIVTAFCWVFLYLSYNAGFAYCSEAEDEKGVQLTIFTSTRAFLGAYVCMIFVVVCVGTYLRKYRPVRGELYVPSVDGELHPPCNLDFKDMRERPAPRLCPDLWADCEDPDSRVMCKPCGPPCKHCWNTVFTVVIAPIGYAIELFYRHRHFIGP